MLWDYCEIKGKCESLALVKLLPWEISWFCKYFLKYNSELDATVCSTKFHRSPLPQGGLEILIKLWVGKGKGSLEIFKKTKGFMLDNYLKPEKNPVGFKDRRWWGIWILL